MVMGLAKVLEIAAAPMRQLLFFYMTDVKAI